MNSSTCVELCNNSSRLIQTWKFYWSKFHVRFWSRSTGYAQHFAAQGFPPPVELEMPPAGRLCADFVESRSQDLSWSSMDSQLLAELYGSICTYVEPGATSLPVVTSCDGKHGGHYRPRPKGAITSHNPGMHRCEVQPTPPTAIGAVLPSCIHLQMISRFHICCKPISPLMRWRCHCDEVRTLWCLHGGYTVINQPWPNPSCTTGGCAQSDGGPKRSQLPCCAMPRPSTVRRMITSGVHQSQHPMLSFLSHHLRNNPANQRLNTYRSHG